MFRSIFFLSLTLSFLETPSGLDGYCLELQMALVNEIGALSQSNLDRLFKMAIIYPMNIRILRNQMRNVSYRELSPIQEPENGKAGTKTQACLIPKVMLNSKDTVLGQE